MEFLNFKSTRLSFCIAFIALLWYSTTTFAATKTFTNTAGGSWTTANNWSPNGQPAANDDVIIPDLAAGTSSITNVPTITLKSLTFTGANSNSWLCAASSGNTISISSSWVVPSTYTLTIGNSGQRLCWKLLNTSTSTINGYVAFDAGTTNRLFEVYGTLIVNSTGCIYDPNPSGGSDFVFYTGATLKTQKPQGWTTTAAANAAAINYNVAVSTGGSYTYQSGLNFEYNGTSGQITGAGLSQNTPATLTVNLTSGNTLTLTANTSISGSLVLTSGLLATATTSLLTMLNGSTAPALTAASTSYINGPMKYQKTNNGVSVLNFPIGKGADCRPMQLSVNAGAGAASTYYYLGESFNASAKALGYTMPATIDTVSSVHYWDITRTDAAGVSQPTLQVTNASIQLHFGPNDMVKDLTTLRVVKNTYTATTAWTDLTGGTTGGTTTTGNITSAYFSSFSRFTLAGNLAGANPLPVELISFNASSEGSHNSVDWKSAVETNFNHYELESSEDGINFTKISTVNPMGNIATLNNYNYLDFNPYIPITYYRLKMVDLDYTFKYSQVIAVENGSNKTVTLVVFPNPASNELYVKLSAPNEKTATIDIKDILGRTIYLKTLELSQTADNTYINTFNFASGTYIVNVLAGNSISENVKVIINKN